MANFTFLVASARTNGNSERLAKIAAAELASEHDQRWLALRDFPLSPFEDLRHEDGGYGDVTGNASKLCEATLQSDELVFVTPLYWYSVPAPLKLYLDHWSHWMRVASLRFKEVMSQKRLWVIAASAGNEKFAQPMFESLKLSADFLNMRWGGKLLGNGSAPGDVLNDTNAVEAAKSFFEGC